MLHVACSTDRRFAADCAVMLASLVATNRAQELAVHFLHDGTLSQAEVDDLRAIAIVAGASFEVVELAGDRAVGLARSERFPIQIWYRALLPELLPRLDRVLYLDADTLVADSLAPLWQIDLEGKLVGAVTNPLLSSMVNRVQNELGLPDESRYFNSGVLLIDLEAWRREGTAAEVVEFAVGHPGLIWPDQDALNAVLHSRRLALHPRWNAMPGLWNVPMHYLPHTPSEVREAAQDPAIVHFVGPHKPWHYRSRHPYRARYFTYLEQSPWRGRPTEGRSPWQAFLRPLPWLWAYRIETGGIRARRKIGMARYRLRARFK